MQREYDLDLAAALPTMSWRRFLVLVRGLSPASALVTTMGSRARIGGGRRQQTVNVVSGDKAAQRTFEMLFRPAGRA